MEKYSQFDAEIRKVTELPGLDDPTLLVQYITGLQDSLQVVKLRANMDVAGKARTEPCYPPTGHFQLWPRNKRDTITALELKQHEPQQHQ